MNGILTIKEAAEILKVNMKSLEKLCREGKIPGAFKVGSLWRIHSDSIYKQGDK